MTNKEKYINSFSVLEPSDKIKERIMNMTTVKKKISFRALAVAAAVLMILAVAMLTANAATDGELARKFVVLLNGQVMAEGNFELSEKLVTDENGNTQSVFEFSLNGDGGNEDEIIIIREAETENFAFEVKTTDGEESVHYEVIED